MEVLKLKSNIKVYWVIWLVLLSVFLILFFTLFRDEPDTIRFRFFIFYTLPTWVAIVIVNLFEGRRLLRYLRENRKAQRGQLLDDTTPGGENVNAVSNTSQNPSLDSSPEQLISELKRYYKKVIVLMVVILITTPLLFLVVMKL